MRVAASIELPFVRAVAGVCRLPDRTPDAVFSVQLFVRSIRRTAAGADAACVTASAGGGVAFPDTSLAG
jgi:hypothetical protein